MTSLSCVSPPQHTQYRAFNFAWLVDKSQKIGRPTSQRWVVGNDGWVYMYTPFDLQFDVATTGYGDPHRYPKDDPRCFE